MKFPFPKKMYVSAEHYWDKKIMYGYLTILAENFEHIEAGYYLSNEAGSPFAYRIKPNTVNVIVSKSTSG